MVEAVEAEREMVFKVGGSVRTQTELGWDWHVKSAGVVPPTVITKRKLISTHLQNTSTRFALVVV